MKKILLIIAGCLSLGLGILGIPVPLLPTTPFLLLSAYCFAHSSDRLYNWLTHHRTFGTFIKNWEQHRGMQARHKKRALVLTLVSFVFSIHMMPLVEIKLLLVFIGTCVMTGLSRVKTIPEAGAGG